MFARSFVFAMVLSAAALWAQAVPPQTPPPSGQAQTPAGGAASQRPSRAQRMQQMQEMRQQRLQALRADLQRLRTLVDKMKADAANIQDPTGKQVAQDNIDLWEALVQHIEQEVGYRQQMGPPPAGMGRYGMRSPKQPTTTPPQNPPPEL